MLSFHDKIYYIQLSQTWRRFNESKKWKLEYYVYFIWNFFSFVTFCFFFKNWTKKKISLSFIYPPPIFLKKLSDNKDILYLFFSINMCKNILMKKMYLCLLNIRHTKKKRRKKLAFHIASFMNTQLWTTLSLHERGCLWKRKNSHNSRCISTSHRTSQSLEDMNQRKYCCKPLLCTIVCKEAHLIILIYFESVYSIHHKQCCS